MRVLLAEDNAIARTALGGRLRGEGYEVDLAEDGEIALGQVRDKHPDIVIADVLMPRMDGYSLCRAIKDDPALNTIPVVFYSATFITPEDRQLAESVGASRFVQKSGDLAELNAALKELLNEFEQSGFSAPPNPPVSEDEINKFYEQVLSSKLTAKVDELEKEKKALRDSERRYQQLVTTIPDVIFVLNLPRFEATYIAPEAERLIGVPGDEVLGDAERWVALVHAEDRKRVMQELLEAVAEKRGLTSVFRMYHREGGFRWIEGHMSMVLDESGGPKEMLGVLTDITERKLAEERLVESERSLATLFSNLPGMAYRCRNTPEWKMEFVSDGVVDVTGYNREELIDDALISYNDIVHPEDQLRVWEEVQQAIAEGRRFSLSYRIIHKDGKPRWVWERGVGVPDRDDGPMQVEGFITDITLRKRAEEQLIESERRYRKLFEMMVNGMAVHELVHDEQGDPVDFRYIEINPAFESLTGLKADDILGRTSSEASLYNEKSWIDEYIDVVRSGNPAQFLRYLPDRGGRYFDVLAFKNADNQFVTLSSDVTAQRKSEEMIENLARFPEENPSPVLRIDEQGILLYANPATDFLRSEWMLEKGKPIPAGFLQQIRQSDGDGNRFMCNIGSRWFSFLLRPVREGGYINIYSRDVTNEYLTQQDLVSLNRALQTMSEGNRTLVHAASEEGLLKNICRVFTQEGDYPAAWISVLSEDNQLLDCLTSEGKLKDVISAWGWQHVDLTNLSHPLVKAFTSGENIIINRDNGSVDNYQLDGVMAINDIESVFLLPIQYQSEVFGVIGIFSLLPVEMQEKELLLLDELASDIGYGVHSHRTQRAHDEGVKRFNNAMMHTIEAVSIALEKRDPYTAGHQNRVASLSTAIAREMGFSEDRIEGIRLGSMVHDIGKISVPAEILNRPGKLSKDEFGIIKAHPEAGYDILKGVDFPWPITQMIIQHHERIDGTGYPKGLKGDDIEPEARILAVADVVEAITSHRPYRPSLGLDIALEEIEHGRGTAYDPEVVDACLKLFREKGFKWE